MLENYKTILQGMLGQINKKKTWNKGIETCLISKSIRKKSLSELLSTIIDVEVLTVK